MDALEAEAAGLMGALAWARDHERHREALELAYALNPYWSVRGRWDEARRPRPWALESARRRRDGGSGSWSTSWPFSMSKPDEGRRRGRGPRRRWRWPGGWATPTPGGRAARLAVLDAREGDGGGAGGVRGALALARRLGDPAAERTELHAFAVLDANEGEGRRRGRV